MDKWSQEATVWMHRAEKFTVWMNGAERCRNEWGRKVGVRKNGSGRLLYGCIEPRHFCMNEWRQVVTAWIKGAERLLYRQITLIASNRLMRHKGYYMDK